MSVTVAIRFPLGRYHANPWDRSVNEGAVEWPPSPWRLLRTLVSTWYTRWPELPAPVLDRLLDGLGDPPSYLTPRGEPGHTRHYLPGVGHKKGETGGTELTLDPFLWVSREEDLLVRWDAELTGEQREVLGKLVELVPYLGRAESICEARLLDTDETPDETWWRPEPGGGEPARLLAPVLPVRRALLELGTVEMRRQRRTMPPDTRWVTYTRSMSGAPAASPRTHRTTDVDAIRLAVVSKAPLKSANGVLLADEVHRIVTRALDGGRWDLLGHSGASTDHRHAHWIPLAEGPDSSAPVTALVVWVQGRLRLDEVAEVIRASAKLRRISGRRGGNGYEVKGLPEVDLLLQGAGRVETVAPELVGPARRWRSLTPYLPVRHHKPRRETFEEYLAKDVRTELHYRSVSGEVTVQPEEDLPAGWALGFRRYRMKEHLGKARRGVGLRLEFDAEVEGPLLLGQLSHFGYGIFVPE